VSQMDLIPQFDGATYSPERDHERLATQLERVKLLMRDGRWRTLRDISKLTDTPEASASAQLRNLRKPRFGGYTIERRYIDNGLYEYRVLPWKGAE